MKTLTRTQIWIPEIRARMVKDRLEQAKLVIAEVRERARVTCCTRFNEAPNAFSHRAAETALG